MFHRSDTLFCYRSTGSDLKAAGSQAGGRAQYAAIQIIEDDCVPAPSLRLEQRPVPLLSYFPEESSQLPGNYLLYSVPEENPEVSASIERLRIVNQPRARENIADLDEKAYHERRETSLHDVGSSLHLVDIQRFICPDGGGLQAEAGIHYDPPRYSTDALQLAKNKAFVSQILSSVARQAGCSALLFDSLQGNLREHNKQIASLAPSIGLTDARHVMQLVLDRPHGQWATSGLSVAQIFNDPAAKASFIRSIENCVRAAAMAYFQAGVEANKQAEDIRVITIESSRINGNLMVMFVCNPLWNWTAGRSDPRTVEMPAALAAAFQAEFGPAYRTLHVHPLCFMVRINMAALEPEGNKRFPRAGGGGGVVSRGKAVGQARLQQEPPLMTGPAEAKRPYRPPHGWVRIGLKVVSGDDSGLWLGPLDNNQELWYRAYFGTDRSALSNMLCPEACESHRAQLRQGVYVSPHADYADRYGGQHQVHFQDGSVRTYRCVIMCAVRPGSIDQESHADCPLYPAENSSWVVSTSDAVRPYGVLFKLDSEVPPNVQPASPSPPSSPPRTRQRGGSGLHLRQQEQAIEASASTIPHLPPDDSASKRRRF